MRKAITFAVTICVLMTVLFSAASATASSDYTQWKQYDPEWNQAEAWPADPFCDAEYRYMKQAGCFVTSLAMLLRHYDVITSPDVNVFNPWICNERLVAANAFDTKADIQYSKVAAAFPEFQFVGIVGYSQSKLIDLYNEGYACFIHVNNYSHFIALRSIEGTTINIMDPGSGKTTLSEFGSINEIIYYKVDVDKVSPEIENATVNVSGKVRLSDGNEGFRISFTAKDDRTVEYVKVHIWQYGQSEADAIEITQNISSKPNESVPVTIDVSLPERFNITTGEGIFYYNITLSDGRNIVDYNIDYRNNVSDCVNLFSATPSDKISGTYKVKTDTYYRDAPYEKWNGKNTRQENNPLSKGTVISVVGHYTNSANHEWFLTNEGQWVYGERLTKYTSWNSFLEKLKKYAGAAIYVINGQVVKPQVPTKGASVFAVEDDISASFLVSGTVRASDESSTPVNFANVKFMANGGYCSKASVSYRVGAPYGSFPTPTRFGYTFDGWFTSADGGTQVSAGDICPNSGTTLYAHWTRIILLQGSCGPNVNFVLYGDGELDITGSGEMTSHPWTEKYKKNVFLVSMEGNITCVSNSAFENCIYLSTVRFVDTVSIIGNYAFSNCTDLKDVSLPSSLRSIGEAGFKNCTSISNIIIPKALETTKTSYPGGPFAGCSSLASAIFEDGITIVPDYIFSECSGLETVVLPNSILEIGDNAFYACGKLTNLTLPINLQNLGESSFNNCTSITSIIIPKTVEKAENNYPGGPFEGCSSLSFAEFEDGMTKIPDYLFSGCNGLKKVSFSNSITEIGRDSFYNCVNLTDLKLPPYIQTLGESAFENCSSITSIFIPRTLNKAENDYPGGPFEGCSTLASVTFEDGMTTVPDYLFSGCNGLISVAFPNSVTEIGDDTFYNCINLTNVKLPPYIQSLGASAFENCTSITSIFIPKTLTKSKTDYPGGPFEGCGALASATFEEGITTVPDHLFSGCNGLKLVQFPNSITKIGESAFCDCTSLDNLSLPEYLKEVDYQAFSGCKSIKEIVLPDSVESIGEYLLSNCTSLTKITLPTGIEVIPRFMFSGCSSLEEYELPPTIITISSGAFKGCISLKHFVWGSVLTTIGSDAFRDCDALTTVSLPSTVINVGSNAFTNCDTLAAVTIPNSVTTLGTQAFYNCDSLKTVELGNGLSSISKELFYDCDALASVSLGSGIKTISDSAFEHCDSLEKLVLPYKVTTLGSNVFKDCVKLKELTIPRTTTSIQTTAVSYPDILTIYGVAGTTAESYAKEIGATFVAIDIPVQTITLNQSELTMNRNATIRLIPTITPSDFTDEIVWKSSDTSVATVDTDGNVKGVKVGTATISVVGGNVKATCKVTVVQPVTSISLSKTTLSLEAGSTYTLKATVSPGNANNKSVAWSSSDETIATVTQEGVVTALKKGTATITCTAQDGSSVSKSCTVTVPNDMITVTDVKDLQSTHPYAVNCSDVWVYQNAGAESLNVTFSENTSVEDGSDYIYLYDAEGNQIGTYTGNELAGKTITIPGDTVKIKLVSDASYCEYGFAVTNVEAVSSGHTHSLAAVPKVNATCTKDGTEAYWKCSGCGKLFSDEQGKYEISAPIVIKATGHKWDGGKVTKEPTENSEGVKTFTCTVCGETRTETIPALDHTHTLTAVSKVNATCTKDGTEAYWKCSSCGKLFSDAQGKNEISAPVVIKATGHKWDSGKVTKEPTETAEGVKTFTCTVCGETRTEAIPALSHTHTLTAVPKVNATCTKDGTEAYWKCNSCGKMFSDAQGKNEISAPAVIKATGHKWDGGKVTKEPTENAEGLKTFTCTACGETHTESIPKLIPKPVSNPFSDVAQDQYYFDPVLWAVNHQPQITNGTSATTFSPDATCTRGQVVTFLWRAKGCPEPKQTNNPFTDVTADAYYYKAVLWAVEQGITNGTSATTFSPDQGCTRGQVVTFLWRAEGKPAQSGTKNGFTDVQAGQYYYDAVLWAVAQGITNGTSATTFSPDATCTRGQIVTFLYRDMK